MSFLILIGITIGLCFGMQNISIVAALPTAASSSLSSSISVTAQNKTYRSDYEYNSKTDAFYKLHTESASHKVAKSICNAEGASLMLLSDTDDIAQAQAMIRKYPNTGNRLWLSNIFDEEDDAKECLFLKQDSDLDSSSCSEQYSFVCKVKAKDVHNNDICKSHGLGYVYSPSVGGCYSVSQVLRNWEQARAECLAQGAHLVILNSLAEVQIVRDLMIAANKVDGQSVSLYFYAGIKAYPSVDKSETVWKTVLGDTLQDDDFDGWDKGEPNNWHNDDEFCGGISIDRGRYNDINCFYRLQFVCEAELPLSSQQ